MKGASERCLVESIKIIIRESVHALEERGGGKPWNGRRQTCETRNQGRSSESVGGRRSFFVRQRCLSAIARCGDIDTGLEMFA